MSFLLHNLLLRDGVASAGTVSGAALLAAGYAQAFALDFTDDTWLADTGFYGSAYIKDTGTPANDYDSSPTLTASSLLTYTAPSLKMTMGPSGTLRFQAHNLCLHSSDLTNAAWTKANASAAKDAVGFDGVANSASTLTAAAGTVLRYAAINPAVVAGCTYSWRVYLKAGTHNFVQLLTASAFSGTNYVNIDLSNGSVPASSGYTPTVEDVGGGWYLVSIDLGAAASTSGALYVSPISNGTVARAAANAMAGTETIVVYGSHLRRTPSDSTYLATTSAARYALPLEWGPNLASGTSTQSVTVAISTATTPRRYSVYYEGSGSVVMSGGASGSLTAGTPTTVKPTTTSITLTVTGSVTKLYVGEALGLLVEEARTNLVTYSEQFDNAAWTKSGSSVSANGAVAPDGQTTMDALIEDSGTSEHYIIGGVSTASGNTSISVFAKLGTGTRYLQIRPGGLGSGKAFANFNLSTGEVVGGGTGGTEFVSATIASFGGGIYRCTLVGNYASGPTAVHFVLSNGTTELPSYTGDGASSVYLWGAQVEAGAFVTSPIPTLGSTVTRALDNISKATSGFAHSTTETTMFLQCIPISTSGATVLIEKAATPRSDALMAVQPGAPGTVTIGDRGALFASQCAFSENATIDGATVLKAAISCRDNLFDASINGSVEPQDTSGTHQQSPHTRLQIGGAADGGSVCTSRVQRILVLPETSTAAALQTLTGA